MVKSLSEINLEFLQEQVASANKKARRRTEQYVPRVARPIERAPAEAATSEIPRALSQPEPPKPRRSALARVGDVLFYLAIAVVILTALTHSSSDGAPKMILNYAYFTVLSPSMQSEIPRGSLVVVKHRASGNIKVGDTVTFMRDEHTTVTHKVVDIIENYNNSGDRGFQTKGVNNDDPDKNIVYASNVVGVVVLHIPRAGAFLAYLGGHIYIVFVLFGLLLVLSLALSKFFALARGERNTSPKAPRRRA
jgi:signal peptidase